MKRFCVLWLACLFLCCAGFSGCRHTSFREKIGDAPGQFGTSGILYAPEIPEGEDGYVSGAFLGAVYGGYVPEFSDYAVFLGTSFFAPSECGIFLCQTVDEALLFERVLSEREAFFTRTAGDTPAGGAKTRVSRHGKTVLYAIGKDADKMMKTLEKIK